MEIAILGSGAFGSALAALLGGRGHDITLWCFGADEAAAIQASNQSLFLPGHPLGARVRATNDLAAAVTGKPVVLVVSPSHSIRTVLGQAAPHLDPAAVLVNASKGIEVDTLATIDRIFADVLPAEMAGRAAFLSGPTFAKELVQGLPGAIVVASRVESSALLVQREFSTERLRVYTTDDVTGVELCGALKNVCAIGAGISDGCDYGLNARAAFITRGLSEIIRLGRKLGAHPMTFAGLAGMGDLVLTCTGDLSRNRRLGLALGRGMGVEEALASLGGVAEGMRTSHAAWELAHRLEVDAPIIDVIHDILYRGKDACRALPELMLRPFKPERA
jgi:glycerol-3-phosphate dehydrogenase (NAD(P)+)